VDGNEESLDGVSAFDPPLLDPPPARFSDSAFRGYGRLPLSSFLSATRVASRR